MSFRILSGELEFSSDFSTFAFANHSFQISDSSTGMVSAILIQFGAKSKKSSIFLNQTQNEWIDYNGKNLENKPFDFINLRILPLSIIDSINQKCGF